MPPHGHHPALPLAGVRVVVTRAAHQAGSTVRAFEEAGARVELLPLLEVVPPADPEPLDRALARLEDFSWVLFTSTNTVEQVLERLPADASAAVPEGVRIAAVGPSTGDALRERGFDAGPRGDRLPRRGTGRPAGPLPDRRRARAPAPGGRRPAGPRRAAAHGRRPGHPGRRLRQAGAARERRAGAGDLRRRIRRRRDRLGDLHQPVDRAQLRPPRRGGLAPGLAGCAGAACSPSRSAR